MLNISGTGIAVSRGDDVRFAIVLKTKEPIEGVGIFTVRKAPKSEHIMIEKIIDIMDNRIFVILDSEDTCITPGTYFWDVRLREESASGTLIETPMKYGSFQILEVIGDA